MSAESISTRITLAELFQRWPQTVEVFLRRRLACPGCSMAAFDTLSEAIEIYQVSLDDLLSELQESQETR